jgi:hypothetical protein
MLRHNAFDRLSGERSKQSRHPMRWFRSVARLAALAAVMLMAADDVYAGWANAPALTGGNPIVLASRSADRAGTAAAFSHRRVVTAQIDPSIYPDGSLTDLFNSRGWLGEFAAGLLGSGVLGLLFGRGLFGGLGGVPTYLGLICQIVLIVMLCRLILTRWYRADAPGAAAMSPRQLADVYLRNRDDLYAGSDPSAEAHDLREEEGKPPAARKIPEPSTRVHGR